VRGIRPGLLLLPALFSLCS